VRDIMTASVYTIPADAPIAEIARTMVDGHVHRLLVAEGDKLVGIVSTLDLLRAIASAADPIGKEAGSPSRSAPRR
jgi:CBS domain-containing protein